LGRIRVVAVKVSGALQIPIRPGMREDIDQRAGAEPGTLLYAQNVRFRQMGRAERRLGSVAVGSTISPALPFFPLPTTGYPPDFAATLGGAACVGSNGYAHQYDETNQVWRPAGLYSSAMPVRKLLTMYARPAANRHVAANGAASVAIDSAGYMLVAYCTQQVSGSLSSVHYQYLDPTGNPIEVGEVTSRVRVRCVAVGATIYMVTQDDPAASNIVRAYTFAAGATIAGPSTLFTLDATADSWDVSPWPAASASNRWLVVWYDSSSTTVTVRRLNALATEADQTFTPAGAPRIACHAHTNHAWIGTVDDTSQAAIIRGYPWSGSWGAAVGPTNAWTFTAATQDSSPPIPGATETATTIAITGWVYNADGAVLATGGTYENKTGRYTSAASVSVSTYYNYYPITYPFGPDGSYTWADVTANDRGTGESAPGPRRAALVRRWLQPTQSTLAEQFVELSTPRNAQWIDDSARVDRWTRVAQRPNGNWIVPVAVWIPDDSTGSIYYDFYEFEAPCQKTRTLAYSAGALTAPGQPVDLLPTGGFSAPENGVVHAPTITYAAAVGGGSMAAGDYYVTACYKWIDAAGRVRRSAPARPVKLTLALNDSVRVYVTTISLFRQRRDASGYGVLEIYGSPPNEALFYLVDDSEVAQAGISASNGIAQFTALNWLAADITDNIEIYTDGGTQQNDLAPSCRAAVPVEDGLWVGPCWDRTIWQRSKIILPEEPANFSDFDGFKVRFPEDTVTGVNMDGALIVFSERAIYAQIGEGPTDQGQGNFGAPRCIVSGIGCRNERSVVMTPLGCFFESERGIELLPRGLGQPVFIGEPIQDQLALRPTILDAAFHVGEDATTVRFLVEGATLEPDTIAHIGTDHSNGLSDTTLTTSGNHTLAAGSNRIVLIGVAYEVLQPPAADVTGATVTYGGLPCTLIASDMVSSTHGVMLFAHLESGLVTGANTVAVQLTQSAAVDVGGMRIGCVAYSNVRQVLPSRTNVASGSSASASNFLTPSVTGAVMVDAVSGTGNSVAGTTVGAGQTQRVAGATGGCSAYMSDEAAAGLAMVTMSWALNASQDWHSVVVELEPTESLVTSTRTLVYDLDAKAWSVDDHPIDAGALGVTPLGLMFANADLSATPAFLVEDSSSLTDGGSFFASQLTLHDFIPAGFLGITHVQSVAARVLLEQNPTTLYLSLGTDGGTPRLGTWTGTDTSTLRYYETEVGNASNQASTVQVDAYDAAGGVTWCGFVLYHEPEPETGRPLAPTERY
jgi:hypothetical protein